MTFFFLSFSLSLSVSLYLSLSLSVSLCLLLFFYFVPSFKNSLMLKVKKKSGFHQWPNLQFRKRPNLTFPLNTHTQPLTQFLVKSLDEGVFKTTFLLVFKSAYFMSNLQLAKVRVTLKCQCFSLTYFLVQRAMTIFLNQWGG